ncbi:MAG: DUF4178 domain-containing protein [Anaerolineae bacterium]|nr:DUF4178 domain-containing protein [Anaerolineae bacterium]
MTLAKLSTKTVPVAKKKALKCPKCGGDLTRHLPTVTFMVCPKCGSSITLSEEELNVVAKKVHFPPSVVPIQVGQVLTLREVKYFVLGRVLYEGWDDDESWQWTEWLLGARDGQLRWLSYSPDEGFVLFQKARIRGEFDPFKAAQIPIGNGEHFWVKERYLAKIVASEGELTFRAVPNNRLMVVEGVHQSTYYSLQRTADELELYSGDGVMTDEIVSALGDDKWVKKAKRSSRVEKHVGFARVFGVSGILAFGIALLAFMLWMGAYNSGEVITTQDVNISPEFPSAIIIANFDQANRPAAIQMDLMHGMPVNTYAEVEVNVIAPLDEEADTYVETFIYEKEFWHEEGVEDGEYWNERDYSASGRFVPTSIGEHEIEILLGEQTIFSNTVVRVTVYRNQMIHEYYLAFAVGVGILGIILMSLGFPGFGGSLAESFGLKEDD